MKFCPFVFSKVFYWASQVAPVVKNLPANPGDLRDANSLGQADPLKEEMATHSSILA